MSHAGGYPASLARLYREPVSVVFDVWCECFNCGGELSEPGELFGGETVQQVQSRETEEVEDIEQTAMDARRKLMERGWRHDSEGRWFAPGHVAAHRLSTHSLAHKTTDNDG